MEGLAEFLTVTGLVWLFFILVVLFIASFIIVTMCIGKITERILAAIENFFDNL